MSLSKKHIEKIYSIKEKLLVTYKAATTDQIRKSIGSHLKKIEKIISDIENGKEINLKELHIFSDEFKNMPDDTEEMDDDERINYIAKVQIFKASPNNKDFEIDQIYSFFKYFEENLSTPLSASYLKLDYNYSKTRDIIFAHYEATNHLLKEYIVDLKVLSELKFNEQIEKYKSRIDQQKNYFLIKLSELLHEFRDFLNDVLSDLEAGRNSIFNPDEVFMTNYDEKKEFENHNMKTIVLEAYYFILDFIDILRMPDFRKNIQQ